MNTEVAERPVADIVDDVVARGDLSKLTSEQRVVHYHRVCESLGLNPNTQPFQYITLNGKLQLYARKDATDQLRKINGISVEVEGYEVKGGLLTVHVSATDKTGRKDEDYGVVSVAGLGGEAASNAFMKCVTKAKRRVTLSISGLGFSDEEEIESMQAFENVARSSTPPLTKDSLPPRTQKHNAAAAEQITAIEEAAADATRAVTDSVEPHTIELRGNDWSAWCNTFITFVRAAPDEDAIHSWRVDNFAYLNKLNEDDPAKHAKLDAMIEHEIAKRNKQDEA